MDIQDLVASQDTRALVEFQGFQVYQDTVVQELVAIPVIQGLAAIRDFQVYRDIPASAAGQVRQAKVVLVASADTVDSVA